jgi:putative RNA 2'-phosphotransferase
MIDLLSDRLRKQILVALRHRPDHFDLQMNADGWVDVLELGDAINQIHQTETQWDRESIQQFISDLDLHRRLQFQDGYCRAAYGHSTTKFCPANPSLPDTFLFHGTTASNLNFINCYGLQPNGRRFVQLTSNFEYAMQIAGRNAGEAVVIQIQNSAALESGVTFYATGTHVWLATAIPSDCLQTWMTQAPLFDEPAF